MTNVNLDDELYEQVEAFVKKNSVDYPSLKNFVDKAVRKRLLEEKKR